MKWLDCPADQFIFQYLPLFERASHCELILANRQDIDQCSVLARLQAVKFEIERLERRTKRVEVEAEAEKIEPEDLSEINPNEIALSALKSEPLPGTKSGHVHTKRTPSQNRWLDRARVFLQENGPATVAKIAVGLGIQTEKDRLLLNASLHTAYKKRWIFQAGVVHGKRGRASVIWTNVNSAGENKLASLPI